mmetsp:Transcript_1177/g.7633  ORF Transcript_1177/g.7633 Transcript_1177/m.7633 type:complete len:171 (-) Transcript_1177:1459-1971(-)
MAGVTRNAKELEAGEDAFYQQSRYSWCTSPTPKGNATSERTNGGGGRRDALQWIDLHRRQRTYQLDSCNGETCHVLTCEQLDGLFYENSLWMPGLLFSGWKCQRFDHRICIRPEIERPLGKVTVILASGVHEQPSPPSFSRNWPPETRTEAFTRALSQQVFLTFRPRLCK